MQNAPPSCLAPSVYCFVWFWFFLVFFFIFTFFAFLVFYMYHLKVAASCRNCLRFPSNSSCIGWSPPLLTAGQLFPSLDYHRSLFNVLPWEERTPGGHSHLWIPDSSLTVSSSVTWGKSLALANLEFPHLQPIVRNHSWNNKCMSTLKTKTCCGNANHYYTWSSFYELLKENLAEVPFLFSAKTRSQNKSLLYEKPLSFFNWVWILLKFQAHFVKCLNQQMKWNLENANFPCILWKKCSSHTKTSGFWFPWLPIVVIVSTFLEFDKIKGIFVFLLCIIT